MNDTCDNPLALSDRIVYASLGSHVAARLAPCNPMRHAIILGILASLRPGQRVAFAERWSAFAYWAHDQIRRASD